MVVVRATEIDIGCVSGRTSTTHASHLPAKKVVTISSRDMAVPTNAS